MFKKSTIIFLAQLLAGVSLLKKFKKYTQLNHRLHKIVSEYNNRKLIYYLKGITHNTLLKQNYNNFIILLFFKFIFLFLFYTYVNNLILKSNIFYIITPIGDCF